MLTVLLIGFILFWIVALLLSPFGAAYLKWKEAHIESVRVLDTSGKRVTFELVFDTGKTKIETTKIGDSRYKYLRKMCR